MDNKKKKLIFSLIVMIAIIILIGVGSTFAYFSATISSEEGAIGATAAVFSVELDDDISLIKTRVIPSAEKYVDMATKDRLDENGDFVSPYEENGKTVIEDTACIDDNLNEICSIYTFTIKNPMTDIELPLYVTLRPSVNTFENLYFKVLDEEKNVVMEATPMISEETPGEGEVTTEDTGAAPIVLSDLNLTLPKATVDASTGDVIPSEATYSIVMWIMETGKDQTEQDSGQLFAATLNVNASGANGQGITGVFSAAGTE